MYIYIYIHTYICVYIYIYMYMYVCIYIYIYIHNYIIYIYIYILVRLTIVCFQCAHVATCCNRLSHVATFRHILPTFCRESSSGGILHIYIYIYVYIYIYIYIHTYGTPATTPFVRTPSGSCQHSGLSCLRIIFGKWTCSVV